MKLNVFKKLSSIFKHLSGSIGNEFLNILYIIYMKKKIVLLTNQKIAFYFNLHLILSKKANFQDCQFD